MLKRIQCWLMGHKWVTYKQWDDYTSTFIYNMRRCERCGLNRIEVTICEEY